MRALAAFAIALLGPLVVTEGSPLLDALDERIVGGKEAARNTIPWQVAIVPTEEYVPRPFCGGTILCSRYIMTAAHCTAGKKAGDFDVMVGEHDHTDKEGTERRHKVSRIIDHPLYKEAWKGYDFSILELATPIDLSSNSAARPACLPSSQDTKFDKDTKFIVSGWGKLSGDLGQPNVLHHVTLPWVDVSAAEAYGVGAKWGTTKKQLNTMLCAGNMEWGGVSGCMGDSGGPLTWKDPSASRTKLVGVVSFGSRNCGVPNAPSVFGKVTAVLRWIISTTGSCSSAYSSTCGITPKPRPPPAQATACYLEETLSKYYGYVEKYAGKTDWIEWYNTGARRFVRTKINCNWSLRCEVVKGGWSQGESACQKICGSATC